MHNLALTLGALAALALPCHAQGGGDEIPPEVISTSLQAIRQAPESYKGVYVDMTLQFASVGRLQNPFFTRFVASDYANFYVWADESEIWRRPSYDDVFGRCFIAKDNDHLNETFALQMYDRLRVRAVVRNVFQGQPWIEVLSYRLLPTKLDTATLAHLYRGEQLMARREWSRAVAELSLAPLGKVPGHVRVSVHKNLATCYLRTGEQQLAQQQIAMAQRLDKARRDQELVAMARMVKENPAEGLDRSVNTQSVRQQQRPMWEAFHGDSSASPRPPVPMR